MRSPYITLLWDERPQRFERDKLDTAWLILQETYKVNISDMERKRRIMHDLMADHNFEYHIAMRYAIIVFKYNPDI